MRYAYYPGCSLHSTAKEFDLSTRVVCQRLGIELAEIPDWICCGATPAHVSMHLLGVALPVKSLWAVRGMNGQQVLTCCAACYSRLKAANKEMMEDEEIRLRVNQLLGSDYRGEVRVRHLLEVLLEDVGLEVLRAKTLKRMEGLAVASYYGCLLVRPPKVMQFDDPEKPHSLDDLVSAVGAQTIDWPYNIECCGASLSLTRTEIVLRLSHDILADAQARGANCVAVACPLCQSNLDLRQREAEKAYGVEFNMPILYFTQIIGLALGSGVRELGLNRHTIDPIPLLKAKGLI
jgi:heterodisulfide reductase subunit B